MSNNNKNWKEAALELATFRHTSISWRQIAELLDVPKSTVSDFLRRNLVVKLEGSGIRDAELIVPPEMDSRVYSSMFAEDVGDGQDLMDWPDQEPYVLTGAFDQVINLEYVPEPDNSRILFISDMHIPYHNKGLLPFLEGLKTRYEPTRVICLGDELDKHAMSFHDSDPDLPSAGDELKKALPTIKEIEKLFPKMDLIDSNHGSLLYRKAKHHGIPRHYLRSYNEVLEVGEGWKWHFDLTLTLPDDQKVYVHHGKGANALRVAQLMGMSYVAGHYHEQFGVQYCSTPASLIWAMQCGCLIDRKSLAFAYSNSNMKRQIIGTGLIIDGNPVLEAMAL